MTPAHPEHSSAGVQVIVDRALAARIEELEREAAHEKARAETFYAQLAEAKDRAYAAERCADVMREGAARIKPTLRAGDIEAAMTQAQWVAAQRPEGWRPE